MKLSAQIIFLVLIFSNFNLSASFRGGGRSLEGGMFWGADLNRNHCIDKEEAKAVHNLAEDEIFERYDKDENGCINEIEFREFMQQSPWTKPYVAPDSEQQGD